MANAEVYCRVKWCRYPYAHITSAHKCGGCDAFGHGRMECGNRYAESQLTMFRETLLPQSMHCDIFGCIYPQTHTRESHHCHHCFRQDHGERDCIIKEMNYYSGRYNNLETDLRGVDNIFFKEPAGMGNIIYIRKKDGRLKFLTMHSDNWGQYGDSIADDVPRLNKFIDGLDELNRDVVDGLTQIMLEGMPEPEPDQVPMPEPDQVPVPELDQVPVAAMDVEEISNIFGGRDGPNEDLLESATNSSGRELHDMWDEYVSTSYQSNVKCPLCRTMNEKIKVKQIKGLSDTCSVCLTNSVSLYFPKCEHACVCQECYDQL